MTPATENMDDMDSSLPLLSSQASDTRTCTRFPEADTSSYPLHRLQSPQHSRPLPWVLSAGFGPVSDDTPSPRFNNFPFTSLDYMLEDGNSIPESSLPNIEFNSNDQLADGHSLESSTTPGTGSDCNTNSWIDSSSQPSTDPGLCDTYGWETKCLTPIAIGEEDKYRILQSSGLLPIRDELDGVYRCRECLWEVVDGQCSMCEITYNGITQPDCLQDWYETVPKERIWGPFDSVSLFEQDLQSENEDAGNDCEIQSDNELHGPTLTIMDPASGIETKTKATLAENSYDKRVKVIQPSALNPFVEEINSQELTNETVPIQLQSCNAVSEFPRLTMHIDSTSRQPSAFFDRGIGDIHANYGYESQDPSVLSKENSDTGGYGATGFLHKRWNHTIVVKDIGGERLEVRVCTKNLERLLREAREETKCLRITMEVELHAKGMRIEELEARVETQRRKLRSVQDAMEE